MKAALQAYIDGFNASNAQAIIALFADDASIEDPVGSQPIEGKEAITEFYQRAVEVVESLTLAAPIRGSHTNAAAMAFDIEMVINNKRMVTRAIDVMEFDADGKIISMRAYWGPGDAQVLS